MYGHPPEPTPAERYAAALADLRQARDRYVALQVPMDRPGEWSHDQQAAVHAYAHAWTQVSAAAQAVALDTTKAPLPPP